MSECPHRLVYIVCEAELGSPDDDVCWWQCPACGAKGDRHTGRSAFAFAEAEAQLQGSTVH